MPELVRFACGALFAAITFVLGSLLAERVELGKRIRDLNSTGEEGGLTWRNRFISILNFLSNIMFLMGIGSIALFLMSNT